MKKYIIHESAYHSDAKNIETRGNVVRFTAILQEANKKNRNGRIYFKKVLQEALESPYIKERLATKGFFVEIGHPMDPSLQRQMTVDVRNAAAIITELWWEGDYLKGRLETMDTVLGRDLAGLIKQGYKPAFSLRAQGNVYQDPHLNATVVESPIQIATYDWVVNPSHDKAFLETIQEQTYDNLFSVPKYGGNRAMALLESANIYENGQLTQVNLNEEAILVDYSKGYKKAIKKLSETYIYDEKDNFTTDGKYAYLINENVTKKVNINEYLLKDIRHGLVNLFEGLNDGPYMDVKADELEVVDNEDTAGEFDKDDIYPKDEELEVKDDVEEVLIEGANMTLNELLNLSESEFEALLETLTDEDIARIDKVFQEESDTSDVPDPLEQNFDEVYPTDEHEQQVDIVEPEEVN